DSLRAELQELLKLIFDLERALARVGAGRANARDLIGLRGSLQPLPRLAALRFKAKGLSSLRLGTHVELAAFLGKTLQDDPPHLLTEGGIVKRGFDPELDKLHAIASDGKRWIANFEAEEIKRSGIPSLKVGYTQVFGYYIEITNAHKEKIPAGYLRRQTLKNAERYITPELKDYETLVLNAEDRLK